MRTLRKKIENDPAQPKHILTEPWVEYRSRSFRRRPKRARRGVVKLPSMLHLPSRIAAIGGAAMPSGV